MRPGGRAFCKESRFPYGGSMTKEREIKVLAVDDHPGNLLALRSILDDCDVTTIEAGSGEAALVEATKHDFALILLDVRLPGIDGLATAARLRSLPRTRDVPIMFLTAFESVEEQVDTAYILGAVDFLIKPIIPRMLMAKVSVFVDLHRKTLAVKEHADLIRGTQQREHERRLAEERAAWEAKQLRREVELQTHIAQEKERSAVILHCIRDAVVAVDAEQRVTLLNNAAGRLFGVTSDTSTGARFEQVIRLVNPETHQVLAPGEVAKDAVTVGGDGREHVVSGTSGPVVDATGQVRGTVFVYRDVTTQRRMERDLSNQQRLDSLGYLAAGIAHDFNNMLGMIMAAASALRDQSPSEEQQLRLIQGIEETCERASGLARQLLTFARGGAPVKRLCDPEPLVRESVEMSLRGGGTHSELRIEGPLWPAELDAGQVTQLFNNLVLNAREATRDKGRLVVHGRNVRVESRDDQQLPVGSYVEFRVEDDGPGIHLKHAEKIFDPYFSTKSDHRGLGLSSAYSIARRHGGLLRLDPERSGGASFVVCFPAVPEGHPEESEPASEQYSDDGHVLVMDDEPRLRELVADCLLAIGCRVIQACTGEEAIDQYRKAMDEGDPFDVVVLDLTVRGGMGGAETLERMRGIHPATLAIACSGYSNDPVMCDPARFGFAAAIEKPFRFAVLARKVRALVHQNRNSDGNARAC